MHVPYCLLISPYQLTDYEHRSSYPRGIYYTHYPDFNYPYYAVPAYPETDYQLDRNISRKEKGIPLNKFLKPKSISTGMPTPEDTSTGMPTPEDTSTGMPTPEDTSTGMPTPEDTSTGMPTPEDTSTGTTIPWMPFSNTLSPSSSSKDGPYGDITDMVESTNKFK
jgi:hypothetical protein